MKEGWIKLHGTMLIFVMHTHNLICGHCTAATVLAS